MCNQEDITVYIVGSWCAIVGATLLLYTILLQQYNKKDYKE